MNYQETLDYIHRVSWTGSRPGLSRMTELLEKLGNPQDSLRFIHVAGTNGKGSFCSMCDSVLREAGYKTGLYTSPYIEVFNERITVDGSPISNDELAEITTYVREFADAMADPPTEFELITAVAMVAYARHGCDPVVLEVGMGGRLDATNVVNTTLLSVITGISKDHTAFLGNTVAEIAAEKAGIIKRGAPVLFGGSDDQAADVISSRANELGCSYTRTARDTVRTLCANLDGTAFKYKDRQYAISLLGLYQQYNAANVIEAVSILRSLGLEIPDEALERGLATAKWRARFELLDRDPVFISDGAHNPEGIDAAVAAVKYYFGDERVCLISGVMQDKDYPDMARALSSIASVAVTLRPDNPRSLDSSLYAAEFERLGVEAYHENDVTTAVRLARDIAKQRGLPLLAIGSLYMYGEVKRAYLKLK